MRRFRFCLFLFAVSCAVCAAAGFGIRREAADRAELLAREESLAQREEELLAREKSLAAAGIEENVPAASRQGVTQKYAAGAKEEYYLVCEDGFLLVFLKDRKTICLYTHIPITDFPQTEQNRLHDGIWFPGMTEVFHYLESYTS